MSNRRWALCAVPAVVFLGLGFVYPVGTVLVRAFSDHTGTAGGPFANFEWYFRSATEMSILGRTFFTAAVVAGVCLLVCYPFAYLLTIVSRPWRIVLFGVVLLAAWQSLLVRTFAWRVILREQGPLNDLLSWLHVGRVSLLGTTTGVIIAMCQIMAPFMILPLYSSMRNIDRRTLLAAQSLGASPWSAFSRIFVPLSLPGMAAGTLLVFIISLGFYITPAVLGSHDDAMVSQSIASQLRATLDWGHAGAISITLLASTLLVVAAARLALRRRYLAVSGREAG